LSACLQALLSARLLEFFCVGQHLSSNVYGMLLQILNKFWEYTRTPSISCQQPSPCTLFFSPQHPPQIAVNGWTAGQRQRPVPQPPAGMVTVQMLPLWQSQGVTFGLCQNIFT
jgi:hypothetical protein